MPHTRIKRFRALGFRVRAVELCGLKVSAVGVLGLYAAGQSGWGTLAMVATGFEGGRGFLHMLCECLRVSVSVGVGVGVSCQ